MKPGKLLIGILAGAALGTAAAVLFAPGKGTDTKDKIAKKGIDLKDNLSANFNESKGMKEKMSDNGKSKIASLIANAKHALS
jgi:gas vesicle protein